MQGKREAAQGRRGSGDEHVMTNAVPIRPARGTWVESCLLIDNAGPFPHRVLNYGL